MKKDEAEKLLCPYDKQNCITDKCMAWEKIIKYSKLKEFEYPYFDEERKQEISEELPNDFVYIDAESKLQTVKVRFGVTSNIEHGKCRLCGIK